VGVIVEDYAPKSIATAIQNLLNDEKRVVEIQQNQQKAAQVLCWEIEQQKLDIYFK
jgi:hypothetical protein